MEDEPQQPAYINRDSEIGLLAMLFHNNYLMGELPHFRPEYFSKKANEELYSEMNRQYFQNRTFNQATLYTALQNHPLFRKSIDAQFSDLDSCVEAHALEIEEKKKQAAEEDDTSFTESRYLADLSKQYTEGIRENHFRNKMQEYCGALSGALKEGRASVSDATAQLDGMVAATTSAYREGQGSSTMTDVLHTTFQRIQDIHDSKSRLIGLPTGYYELDDIISGLQEGLLYVVGGRPSMGKTSFLQCILENVILKENKTAAMFSLEMTKEQIVKQMLCSHSRVDSQLLSSGRVSEEEFQKLILAAGTFHEGKLFINDENPLTIEDLIDEARRLKRRENISMLGIDYLQLLRAHDKFEGQQQEVAYISGRLKGLAKSLKIPVVVLSQLNRGAESNEFSKPRLSNLRESGAIEQDADVVMLLYREDYYEPDSEKKGVAEINIAKNRTGPTNTVELAFLKEFTRFENLAMRSDYIPGRNSGW